MAALVGGAGDGDGDGAAAGDGDGEDGWLGGTGWRTAAPAWLRRRPVVERWGEGNGDARP